MEARDMLKSASEPQRAFASRHRLAVAPMMDLTDRHCRFFHRLLAPRAALYTEMITADAIRFGNRDRVLGSSRPQQQERDSGVILQLGGSDPESLSMAVALAEPYGYAEYNLNVGCPSCRVQSGRFGAALMADPVLVGELVAAMRSATRKPVSVKCRIGIDDMDPQSGLDRFVDAVVGGGVDHVIIHARKAWLKGLSPKENREIPPLDHGRVYALKERLGAFPVSINGGFTHLDAVMHALRRVDGVMMGRAAYWHPARFSLIAAAVSGHAPPDLDAVIERMASYADQQVAEGERLIAVSRHMLGLANGRRGARRWRRILSEEARDSTADGRLILTAWRLLAEQAAEAA